MANIKVRDLAETLNITTDNKLMVLTNDSSNQVQNITFENLISNLNSTDNYNKITIGTDGKLYVDNSPTGVVPDTYQYVKNLVVNAQGQITSVEQGELAPADQTYNPESTNAQSGVAIAGAQFEEMANKVTTISSDSTNTQYPSAKCVFDNQYGITQTILSKSWSTRQNVGTSSALQSFCKAENKIYALNTYGYIYVSNDGINFESTPIAIIKINNQTVTNWSCMDYSITEEKFVALTLDGYYTESTDGVTWLEPTTTIFSSLSSSYSPMDVKYNSDDGKYYIITKNGYIYTTQDFSSFSSSDNSIGTGDWCSLAYYNSKWVACTHGTTIAYSTNPLSSSYWTTETLVGQGLREVYYDENSEKFYALNVDGKLFYSDDGETWSTSNYYEYPGVNLNLQSDHTSLIFDKYIMIGGASGYYQTLSVENYTSNIVKGSDIPITSNNFDGQWVYSSLTLLSGSAPTSDQTVSLSSYLPNDGYNYEVLITGEISVTNTSGKWVYLSVQSDIITSPLFMLQERTNSALTVHDASTLIIPVGQNRSVTIGAEASNAGSANIYAYGYRRIGTNL